MGKTTENIEGPNPFLDENGITEDGYGCRCGGYDRCLLTYQELKETLILYDCACMYCHGVPWRFENPNGYLKMVLWKAGKQGRVIY